MAWRWGLEGLGGLVADVGEKASSPVHITQKPIPGLAYRFIHRFVLVNAQAANSRLLELRNTHTTQLIILTMLRVRWLNSAAHTAIIEDSLDCYKVTNFTVVDTTNTVTITPSSKRTSMGADTVAAIRGVTVAGAAAGMTGGTLTKDPSAFASLPRIFNQAVMAITETQPRVSDFMDAAVDEFGSHPFVFAQNEGFTIENRVLLGAAAGSSVYIECGYSVASAF
jgi:hypothetical protein